MQPKGVVFDGKTLDEAVRKGMEALGLTRAEVMITVLEEGSGGFLGIGARPYRVKMMPRPARQLSERPAGREREGRGSDGDRGRRSGREGAPRGRGGRSEGRGGRGESRAAEGRGGRGRPEGRGNGRGRGPARGDRPVGGGRPGTAAREPAPRPAEERAPREEMEVRAASPERGGGGDGRDRGRRRRRGRGGSNGGERPEHASERGAERPIAPAEATAGNAHETVAREERRPSPPRGDEGGNGMSSEDLGRSASGATEELLRAMGFEATVTARVDGDTAEVKAEVPDQSDLLVGPKGEVRQALQHLLNRTINRGGGSRYHLQLEINDFWHQREDELRTMALRLADEAVAEDAEKLTEYLNSQERRIVHMTLREHTKVTTHAIGEGLIKKIAIAPAEASEGERSEP